jgi:hypothetical protein
MRQDHEKRRRSRVAEPVQVYLAPEDVARLDRLAEHLDATKSDVLRRGLTALERQTLDPAAHPALGIIGLAESGGPTPGYDVAREHDRFLADSEVKSWRRSGRKRRAR